MYGAVDLLRDLQGLLNHGAAILGNFLNCLDQGGVDLSRVDFKSTFRSF